MSQEEDIGALKADMKTVKGQVSKTFDTVNKMAIGLADHMATTTARQDRTDERVEDLKSDHETVAEQVSAIETEQKKIKGALAKVSSVAALIGTAIGMAIVKSVDVFFK